MPECGNVADCRGGEKVLRIYLLVYILGHTRIEEDKSERSHVRRKPELH